MLDAPDRGISLTGRIQLRILSQHPLKDRVVDDHLLIFNHVVVLLNDEAVGRHTVTLSIMQNLLVEDLYYLITTVHIPLPVLLVHVHHDITEDSSRMTRSRKSSYSFITRAILDSWLFTKAHHQT